MKPVHERLIENRNQAAIDNAGKTPAISVEEARERFKAIRESMLAESKSLEKTVTKDKGKSL